jgi:hypothetical protein
LNIFGKAANLFGCELHSFFEDEGTTDDVILAPVIHLDNLSGNDFHEVMRFKDIVISYLKMERLLKEEG